MPDRILVSLVRRPFPELNAKEICAADPGCEQVFKKLRDKLAEAGASVVINAPANHPLAAMVKMGLMNSDEEMKQ
jgi:hypothetical protein